MRTSRSEIVESKGDIVGRYCTSLSVLEPRCDDVLVWIGGHPDESVEAATETIDVPGPDVMLKAAGAVAQGTRLSGREVACLGRPASDRPITSCPARRRLQPTIRLMICRRIVIAVTAKREMSNLSGSERAQNAI